MISGEARDLDVALKPLSGLVVDIGCADRHLSRRLSDGAHYVGLDYPDTATKMYRTRPDVFGDARKLPFQDGSIDAVILKDVLEHISDPQAALAQIARALRPGGKLVLWMPFLYPIHDAPHDYQRFTIHAMTTYLDHNGFTVRALKPVLKPVETAALMNCLACADAIDTILQRRRWLVPLIPVLAFIVMCSNLFGKAMSWLPGSSFMPTSYRVIAERVKFHDR